MVPIILDFLGPNKSIRWYMKQRGRPKGPAKMVFKIRLTPEKWKALQIFALDLTREERTGRAEVVPVGYLGEARTDKPAEPVKDFEVSFLIGKDKMEIVTLRGQIAALLEDVDRLTKELELEKDKVKAALELDLDEKGKLGWRNYFRLKEGGKGEFDQT